MGQSIVEDTPSINDYLAKQEVLWSVKLGALLHKTCHEELTGPARYLSFFEKIAEEYNDREEHLSWVSPITNFPVVQNYKKPISNRTKLSYGDQVLYVVVENWDDATLHKERQRQGASPNFVHSLDAVHLTTVVHDAGFNMSVIHDSFGCVPADMETLFDLVRVKFVELYALEPLNYICSQLNFKSPVPKRGCLNVESVLESEFAFS